MSTVRKSLILLSALGAMGLAAGSASALPRNFVAILYGGNEVAGNGQANAGDPDGLGVATINVVGSDRLCYTLFVVRIGKPSAAHVHIGPAGVNGGVVVPLGSLPSSGNPGVSSACVAVASAVLAAIRRNPGAYYVNVHNAAFPSGAIRGQLQ